MTINIFKCCKENWYFFKYTSYLLLCIGDRRQFTERVRAVLYPLGPRGQAQVWWQVPLDTEPATSSQTGNVPPKLLYLEKMSVCSFRERGGGKEGTGGKYWFGMVNDCLARAHVPQAGLKLANLQRWSWSPDPSVSSTQVLSSQLVPWHLDHFK